MKFNDLVNMFLEEFESNWYNGYSKTNSPTSGESPTKSNNQGYDNFNNFKGTDGKLGKNKPLPMNLFYQAKPKRRKKVIARS